MLLENRSLEQFQHIEQNIEIYLCYLVRKLV